jgi:phosphopentomutase
VFSRAIVIVLDSLGVGELPDAGAYGDEGSNTLGNIARAVPLGLPTLRTLGLATLVPLGGNRPPESPIGAVGRMAEASAGKDSVTGHWEMMGIVLDRPFPVFPNGFPGTLLDELSRQISRGIIGNKAASGTAILEELGAEHLRTGSIIVYTSADSVFQIAAHEEMISLAELYTICQRAYVLACEGLGVGRVIARPFIGERGAFRRTANRRDYAIRPPRPTVLDRLKAAALPTIAIGKIEDLFAGIGISRAVHTASDDEGMTALSAQLGDVDRGLLFVNLVDSDTLYGHRNDVAGYAANLERFDRGLSDLLPRLRDGDLLIVTADHGNDPTTPSTDHSREYVPLLVTGPRVRSGTNLGTRATFADLGQTLCETFAVPRLDRGKSFLGEIA